jgi:hypothetical protein
MNREELKEMRVGICEQNKIQYFGSYTEEQAAEFQGKDPSTLKRWRKAGKIFPIIEPGGKGIRYFGWQIADMIMGRPLPWGSSTEENSSLETGGLESAPARPVGIASGSTQKPDKQSVSALARTTFSKQKTD